MLRGSVKVYELRRVSLDKSSHLHKEIWRRSGVTGDQYTSSVLIYDVAGLQNAAEAGQPITVAEPKER